jgi:hypothetical protein
MLCALAGVLALGVSAASAVTVRKHIFETAPFSIPSSFTHPTGVAVDQETGNVYVTDAGADVVDVFGAEGGSPAGGAPAQITGLELNSGEPQEVAVDNSCYLHKPEQLTETTTPTCKTFDPSNGDVYVAEEPAHAIARLKLNPITQEYEKETLVYHEEEFEPNGVAVDTEGNVYVANYYKEEISEFNSSGVEVGKIEQKTVANPAYVAVGAPGVVYVGNYYGGVAKLEVNTSTDAIVKEEALGTVGEGKAVALDSHGNVYVDDESLISEYEPSGSLLEEFGAGFFNESLFTESQGVAVSDKTGDTYVSNPSAGDLDVFGPPVLLVAPSVTIEPVTPIAQNSATFNGKVNPNGLDTTYHFEDSSDGVHWTSLGQANAGEGESEVPVTQTVSGLTGNTIYHVRLVAHSSAGISISGEETSSTLAGSPEISGTGATGIGATEATLHATIHPEGQATATYSFEYGPTTSYGTTVPYGEGIVGATPTQVSEQIAGLAPGTTYHFRVIASNGVGTPTTTPDQTFTTYSKAEVTSGCPNEQLRKESDVNPTTGEPFSMGLPECRAYEMVSPLLKNGAPILASSVAVVGSEGSSALIKSTGLWPGPEQPPNNDLCESSSVEDLQYRVTRGASGWGFKPEIPSASQLREVSSFILPNSADMSPNGIWLGDGFAPAEQYLGSSKACASALAAGEANLYLLEPDGAVAEIGPSVPVSDRGPVKPGAIGGGNVGHQDYAASTDLSRVLFGLDSYFRWPFDQTKIETQSQQLYDGTYNFPSLYEYIGTGHAGEGADVPTLVGVDNTGTLISQCGTVAAGYLGEEYVGGEYAGTAAGANSGAVREAYFDEPETRVISAGGSTVLFTALPAGYACNLSSSNGPGTGPAVDQLFARVGEPGTETKVGSAVTVNVAGSTECATAAFDSCNVTEAPAYQGASTDGSKVFFTSEQPLVEHDTDSTNNLYECRLPGDSGKPLTPVTPVNPCPELVRVSVAGSGAGAEVQSVVSVSADGSHVYFIAKGVLSGANAEHNSPTAGQDNLYVWDEGRTAFIATLPSAAFTRGEVQATPDGEQLVFTSSADLTVDDTSTVAQVFLYEAQHEALVRVSRGQHGFNDDGNTTTNPASVLNGADEEGGRVISEDGSEVVFESNQALTEQVHGGLHNVYLWRGGNVYLISDGTPAGDRARNEREDYAGLVGIDASGENVFFTTEAQLVGQDTDELSDLYDARIDGGFSAPKVNECAGESCQGAFSAPAAPLSSGSLSSSGAGNLAPALKSTSTPEPKPLTRAQKLAKALKTCKQDKSKKKRAKCEAAARKRYGAKAKSKAKAKRKTGKSSGKGGKR